MSNSSKEPMPVPLEATPAWIETQEFINDMFLKFLNNLTIRISHTHADNNNNE